ncbi:hypothetical protein [Roseimicrobium sp. ORNL1]|uniref:hypothetical protein n=1 Tax=Roseimicrobium sp. ORNL1 TaxID=2711231 RepID=UPI0013E1F68D|nr:hypothetical protein [Roseimicrobium sp. ORNL1]QIF01733.1 hypothetical protein G5S37_09415 [Roseimicrobium sp. ORNL1]
MKSRSSRKPFVVLRRCASVLPMRYRCAALLFSTIFLFPLILLAMGVGTLFSTLVDGLATLSRWVADAAGLTSTSISISQSPKLRDLPPSTVSAPNLRG